MFNNDSIGSLFHISKKSGVQRPFLLLQYDKCNNHKRSKAIKSSNTGDGGDAIKKRKYSVLTRKYFFIFQSRKRLW